MSSSMGRMTSHILWKIKHVPNHQPDTNGCSNCFPPKARNVLLSSLPQWLDGPLKKHGSPCPPTSLRSGVMPGVEYEHFKKKQLTRITWDNIGICLNIQNSIYFRMNTTIKTHWAFSVYLPIQETRLSDHSDFGNEWNPPTNRIVTCLVVLSFWFILSLGPLRTLSSASDASGWGKHR